MKLTKMICLMKNFDKMMMKVDADVIGVVNLDVIVLVGLHIFESETPISVQTV